MKHPSAVTRTDTRLVKKNGLCVINYIVTSTSKLSKYSCNCPKSNPQLIADFNFQPT